MKKFISIILTIFMMLACIPVGVLAADALGATFVLESRDVNSGDTFDVYVKVSGYEGRNSIGLRIDCDTEKLEDITDSNSAVLVQGAMFSTYQVKEVHFLHHCFPSLDMY